ncbi:hypothetical protein EH196_19310 [Bacillus sp. C1-1]|nr:hypothetical protein EH196_19310 [Bacillus sp. C1-1]
MVSSKITEAFKKHALIHDETQYSGDYTKGNNSADILAKLSVEIENDLDNGASIIDSLLKEQNPGILIWASCVSANMNYRKKDRIAILKELSRNNEIGIQRFNAEMTLKEINKSKK